MVQLEGSENRIAARYEEDILKPLNNIMLAYPQFPCCINRKVMDYTPKKNYLPDDVTAVSKSNQQWF